MKYLFEVLKISIRYSFTDIKKIFLFQKFKFIYKFNKCCIIYKGGNMIEIRKLDYENMKGKTYSAEIHSDKYLSIEPQGEGFKIEWVKSAQELIMPLEDDILSDWLEDPVAYGAYEGEELVGLEYVPLFTDFYEKFKPKGCFKVYAADYVTSEDGTGIVHIAPAFGQDDYEVGLKYDLPVLNPVDDWFIDTNFKIRIMME